MGHLRPAILSLTLGLAALLPAHAQIFDDRNFDIYLGFYGSKAYADPAAAAVYDNRLTTGFSFTPPIDTGLSLFVRSRNAGLMFDLPGASLVQNQTAAYIESQRAALAGLGTTGGRKTVWSLMTEWDQSGGVWVPNGRPTYRGLTRLNAYNRLIGYYQNTATPLSTYLATPLGTRPSTLAAITDYSPNTFYAYDLGVDFCYLERGIDELGDLSTGIAFLRGAAAQVDRQWGIDLSTWRTSNNLATSFNSAGTLLGGWSPNYLRRHMYIAYMSGAHAIHIEPTIYYYSNGKLNPFGEAVREFSDFALNRHPDIGRPAVTMALLLDHFSGFDTKHGYYNQLDSVWYQDLAYTDGDYMINNFFKVAYPYHWLQGQTPNAPFLDSTGHPNAAAFQAYLSSGGDPRPYEPMAFTRWGDNLDVITTRTSIDSLRRYKVVALMGNVAIDSSNRDMLNTWVQEGGTLIVNASQVTAADEAFIGARLSATTKTAADSRWIPTNQPFSESSYRYTVVTPTTASRLAQNAAGDALITVNRVGQGQVILTTPAYLQTTARDSLLNIGTKLFDHINETESLAQVIGAPVEYIVNQAYGRTIVTVVNHSPVEWNGTVAVNYDRAITAVREYTQDTTVPHYLTDFKVGINAKVPAYDLRVYAVEFPNQGAAPRQPRRGR